MTDNSSPVADAPAAAPRRRGAWQHVVRWLGVAVALAGWWFSFDLLRLSIDQDATIPWLQQTCGEPGAPDSAINCHSVLRSTYGSVRLSAQAGAPRLPVAALGMMYFGVVGLWYLFVAAANRRGRVWHLLLLALVLFGAVRSLQYIGIMAYELHQWCPGCLVVHGLNGALLVLTILAYPWRTRGAPPPARPTTALALASLTAGGMFAGVQLCLILLAAYGSSVQRISERYLEITTDVDFVVWDHARQPLTEIPPRDPVGAGDPADAAHTVVVFADLQCTACRTAHDTIERARQRHPGVLRVVLRHFPQNSACNPAYDSQPHAAACAAARAVEAARVVGGAGAADRMAAAIFEHQHEIDELDFGSLAVKLGLDAASLDAALNSATVAEGLSRDVAVAAELGVQFPPRLYLDGRELRYWKSDEAWDALLTQSP